MKKLATLITILFLFQGVTGFAQANSNKSTTTNKNGAFKIKWKTSPFDHQVFIENKGQFDGVLPENEQILYAAQLGEVWAYFTPSGIIYRYLKIDDKGKKAKGEKDPDEDGPPQSKVYYTSSHWEGANASVSVTAQSERSDYYTYPVGRKKTIKTNVYSKITYKNIYPGIDIEYMFLKGKSGFKYSITVHPGADISKIMLKYEKTGKLKLNNSGDIVFDSKMGQFTDHAPVAAYSGEPGNINVSYQVKENVESFQLNGNYDKSKTTVIDPWVTNPNFSGSYNRAYDICYDYVGNVYVFGGQAPYQLVKFNNTGVIQWTFTTSAFHFNGGYYGDFAVDRRTGTSYATSGFWEDSAQALKVNTLGFLTATYIGTPNINEMWRAAYNACYDNLIVGAGGTTDSNQACMLDTNLVNITGVDFLRTPSYQHDIALIAIDPSGLYCYMATVQTAGNVFTQLPLPSLYPPTYVKPDHFNLSESNVAKYVAGNPFASGAMNGMAASPDWLYLYNGQSLEQYDKNTGTLSDSIAVSDTEEYWGGIDVDVADDIYLGCRDSIKYYDGSLTLLGSIPMPGDVYDLVLGQNHSLYAAGNGFVIALEVPNPPKLISSTPIAPSSCSACDGKATVNIIHGITPFLFKWSNGSTNQTDTGLCAGVYSVHVTDGSCPPLDDSSVVIINGKPGYGVNVKDTNPGCALIRGNITVYPYGGTPPYVYQWSNGSTNQEDAGLSAGTYTCTITDNTGCKAFASVTLVNLTIPTVTTAPMVDSICQGTSLRIYASGTDNYSWTPPLGLSCNNCYDPIATPSVTTIYTVVGSDTNGCTNTTTCTLKVYPNSPPIITGKDSVCSGYIDTLDVKGGITYLWSNGATTTSINYQVIGTQTITVTSHEGGCTADTSFVIHVVSPAAKATNSKDTVCPGDSVLLTGSGGVKYKWSTGKTSSSIWVTPLTTKTYTLYATIGTCSDSSTVKVSTIPPVSLSIQAINDTVCPYGKTTTLTALGAGGKVNGYRWNTGATTSTISVNDTVTTTYTATVYGVCDSTQTTMKVVVIPLPKPVISGLNWACIGMKDTLTVNSSTNPTKYIWDNGKTTTAITTGAIKADSVVSVTAYNSLGCPVTVSDTIVLRQPPLPVANPPAIFCAGQPITLTASASGSNPPFNYTWSTGQTGTSITIDPGPDAQTTYTVKVSNGCLGTAVTTVIPNVPVLGACCTQTLIIENDTTILVAHGNSIKYKWEEQPDKGTITCLDTLCDSVRVIAPVTTTYTVIGTDSNGCQGEQVLIVNIDIPCFSLKIPNVFTPNNPGPLGLNNVFYLKTENIDAWSLTIFDRWGKEMFSSTNPNQYWNGSTEGGEKAPDGVYYYIIDATCQNTTYKKDGFVQLIR